MCSYFSFSFGSGLSKDFQCHTDPFRMDRYLHKIKPIQIVQCSIYHKINHMLIIRQSLFPWEEGTKTSIPK